MNNNSLREPIKDAYKTTLMFMIVPLAYDASLLLDKDSKVKTLGVIILPWEAGVSLVTLSLGTAALAGITAYGALALSADKAHKIFNKLLRQHDKLTNDNITTNIHKGLHHFSFLKVKHDKINDLLQKQQTSALMEKSDIKIKIQ